MSERFSFEESLNENSVSEQSYGDEAAIPDFGEAPGLSEMYSYAEAVKMVGHGDDAFHYYMSRRYSDAFFEEDPSFVAVDPHVLSTPAMADINQDGHMEVMQC